MPAISVIVPVYNVEAYVEKCLRSVLGQTFRDFEIVAVDDGSRDKSGEICQRLAREDGRIRVVHQENQGLGGARNTGIREAKGQWLLFPDSDDWLEPEALERAYNAAQKHDADMAVFAFQTVNEGGQVLGTFRESLPFDTPLVPEDQRDMLFAAPCAWNKLYRAELFQKTGVLYPPRVWYEDVRTTPKLMAACRQVVFIDYVGYNYLQRAGSIMSSINLERNVEIVEAFEDLLGYFRAQGLFPRYQEELCYLTLFHVYLTASVRVARLDTKCPLLGQFRAYTEKAFPGFHQSAYLRRLTKKQRLLLALVEKRLYGLVRLLFQIKG